MDQFIGVVFLLFLAGHVTGITNLYMEDICGATRHFRNAIQIQLTPRSSYRPHMNCLLTLNTTSNSQIMMYFMDLDIKHSKECSDDYLDVLDGISKGSPYVEGINGRLCGTYMNKYVYLTSNNTLQLHFVSEENLEYCGFDMVITSYHTGQCNVSDYECDNGRCISNSLTCNGYNPCGDHSDCPSGVDAGHMQGWEKAFIVIGVLVVVILIIASVQLFLFVRRRYVRV